MPALSVAGRVITFPANSKRFVRTGLKSTVIDIAPGDITLDACSSGTETTRIYWKQGLAGASFVNCPILSWVGRTAISNVTSVALVGGGSGANVQVHPRGMVYTTDVVANPLLQADVTYSYKRERYDLIYCDVAGVKGAAKGQEVDFSASEFLPACPVGCLPLFYAYVWNDTVELIDAHSWSGVAPKNKLQKDRLAALKVWNQSKLSSLAATMLAGAATIAFYGDSITSVGGGWAATGGADDTTWLDDERDNHAGFVTRDASTFLYWHDAALRTKYPELGSVWPQATPQLVNWGEGKLICAALSAKYGHTITPHNWGIGGTSEGLGNSASGAPNLSEATRLANMNADTFHAVCVDAMMNGFVGYATTDYYTAMVNLVQGIRAAHPGIPIILRCTKGINTENVNQLVWLERANEIYRRVAFAYDCAFIPTYIVTHDDPGYMGISRQHYSGGNRYNHQTPYELAKMAAWEYECLGF